MATVPVYPSNLDACTSEAVIIHAIKALTEKKATLAQSIIQLEKRLAFLRCLAQDISVEEYKRLRELSHVSEGNAAYLQKQKEADLPLRESL